MKKSKMTKIWVFYHCYFAKIDILTLLSKRALKLINPNNLDYLVLRFRYNFY